MRYFVSEGAVIDWSLLPEPTGAEYVDAPLLPEGSWTIFSPDLRAFVWGVPRNRAASTPVSAPLGLSWIVRAGVQQPLALSYAAKNAVQSDLAIAWPVKTSAQQALPLSWAVRQSINRTLALAYPVTGTTPVSSTRDLAWSVLNSGTVICELKD